MKTIGLCRQLPGGFACLGLIAWIAGCGDSASKKITDSQVGADGGSELDLHGVWVTTDFECRNAKRRETIQIDVFETRITGTKIEGDDCVPAGYVVFEGKLPKPALTETDLPATFSFKLYDGAAGDPSTVAIAESGTAKIVTRDSIVLTLATTQLRFSRSTAPVSRSMGASGGGAGGSTSGARGGSGGMSSGRRLQPDESASGGVGGARDDAGRGGSGGAGEDDASSMAGKSGDHGGAAGSHGPAAGSGGASAPGGAGGASGAALDCPGPILPGASCDHISQCGCEDGENCRFDDATPPSCFPAGPAANGELCARHSDCASALLCVRDLCRPMCRTDDDCEGSCMDVTVEGEDVDGLKVCAEPCEPVLPAMCYRSPRPTTSTCNPCAMGATCTPSTDAAFCLAAAFTVLRAPGEACTADEECYGGGCFESVCRAWCGDRTDCSELDATCEKGNGYYAGQGVEVGFCLPGN